MGITLQVAGLVLMPAAVLHGLAGGDVTVELLAAAAGLALVLVGRRVRG